MGPGDVPHTTVSAPAKWTCLRESQMNSDSQGCILILLLAPGGGPQNQGLLALGGSLGRSDLPLVEGPILRSRELTPLPTATE